MKKFLLHFFAFALLVALMDYAYGRLIEDMRAACRGGDVMKEKFVADSVRADVLIFGSSRARMQYVPDIIEDSLGLSCYNCGYNGMGVIYHYGMASMIFERYTPKLIIYDVLPVLEIGTRDDNVIFLNQLRPFYHRNKTIDNIFSDYDRTEPIKMMAQTYRYHSRFLETLACCRQTDFPEKGYSPKYDTMACDVPVEMKLDYDVDSVKLAYLEMLISQIKDKTQLMICASPRYGYTECGNAFAAIEALCIKYNVPFINRYTDGDYVHDHTLYIDATHFNNTGAEKWTRDLMGEIKPIIEILKQ